MTTRPADRPPVEVLDANPHDSYRGRPHVLVLLERPHPASWTLRQVAWFARRLRAELLVAAVVTYDRGLDELDRLKFRLAKEDVEEVTARLLEQGAAATGEVRLAPHGDQALSTSDLADGLDADLVIVLAGRASRLGLFPASPLARDLMRRGRRPVLLIPDAGPSRRWYGELLSLVQVHAPPA